MIILPNGSVAAFFYAVVAFTGVGDHGIVADGRPNVTRLPARNSPLYFHWG